MGFLVLKVFGLCRFCQLFHERRLTHKHGSELGLNLRMLAVKMV